MSFATWYVSWGALVLALPLTRGRGKEEHSYTQVAQASNGIKVGQGWENALSEETTR